MFVWATSPGLDPDALLPVAIDHGTAFVPGSAFSFRRPTEALRLSFATADPDGLEEAVHRLATAISVLAP